jgi:hypothetical protein
MRKVIAVRFDGVLGPTASSITPGKVYPLVAPVYEHESHGYALIEQDGHEQAFHMTVPINRESAHLGGKKWTLIYEDLGTVIISNMNSILLSDITLGKEYNIEEIDSSKVKIKDDIGEERTWGFNHFDNVSDFFIVINNQVINSKKYEHTRTTTA